MHPWWRRRRHRVRPRHLPADVLPGRQGVVLLIAQNAAPPEDLGAASSGVFAARMLGMVAGMAVFGSIVSHRFAEEAARRLPGGQAPAYADAVRPEVLGTLPAPVRAGVAEALADAFSTPFVAALPVLAAGLAAALLLRHVPLAPRGPAKPPADLDG